MDFKNHIRNHEDYGRDYTFLGTYNQDNINYDLYHYQSEFEVTILAVYGNNGGQYLSGMCFGWVEDKPDAPLVVARKRAEELGLDVLSGHYKGRFVRLNKCLISFKD
jgi:hypothetical protein